MAYNIYVDYTIVKLKDRKHKNIEKQRKSMKRKSMKRKSMKRKSM